MSNRAVMTVIGKDRIGIVAEVATLLAEHQVSIMNISQQLMDDYFTMIILLDTERCTLPRLQFCELLDSEGEKRGLHIRVQDEALFNAMHRI
ncbi:MULTISPECIES: ACT domain-containing protein [Snodgrassella]|jgi:ACT domain-containing protein|uniref:UPF0237 protein BHC49_11335 n=1 Tax=Snodgrassella alvi TaxID=1196083 RepID=A0A2N9XD83_9NEIS|nr:MULTISPECIES: ACT domain-containing protein [Snodgrassella]PIT14499.1 hypothetical protein BGI30_00360 [Snodgrassella alvi]PIT21056.1 hypothetical protein BGI36_07140 [Snodgrassella communis]PIT27813.1 hypothetical protein BGI37_03345 [Snodgrassella alvi]PIT45189.1 hypothetical protein BHC51_09555 [Snodgrassella alvi]PIT51081.1 hypothetical protein BHC44_11000 [Snodgrassella alvi]